MIILPAIDIKDNRCVRLKQGDFDRETVFGSDVAAMAKKWEDLGAEYLHVVDLNGALDAGLTNKKSIESLVKAINIPVQIGGGIRDEARAAELINLGVSRIILGTAAVENKQLLKDLVAKFGDKIAVGVDALNGKVATRGWKDVTDVSSLDLIKSLSDIGVKTVIYTDISKDGMMSGPNFEIYEKLNVFTDINIIASGGVSTIDDVKRLAAMNQYGAIIGRALYDGGIDFSEAIKC